jgi:hypothetical protein
MIAQGVRGARFAKPFVALQGYFQGSKRAQKPVRRSTRFWAQNWAIWEADQGMGNRGERSNAANGYQSIFFCNTIDNESGYNCPDLFFGQDS